MADPMRLSPTELDALCVYLYGRRWKHRLSRDLAVDERLVHRWAAGELPVSVLCIKLIVALVLAQHLRRRHIEQARYLALVEAMTSAEVRAALLPAALVVPVPIPVPSEALQLVAAAR